LLPSLRPIVQAILAGFIIESLGLFLLLIGLGVQSAGLSVDLNVQASVKEAKPAPTASEYKPPMTEEPRVEMTKSAEEEPKSENAV
jgi:hypothetical protein